MMLGNQQGPPMPMQQNSMADMMMSMQQQGPPMPMQQGPPMPMQQSGMAEMMGMPQQNMDTLGVPMLGGGKNKYSFIGKNKKKLDKKDVKDDFFF
jgi:hypothetical protein